MALTQINSNSIADGSITNADISSSAAIDESKLTITSVGGANGVDFNDGVKARFGTGNDLEIEHTGSGSFIRTSTSATGDLAIEARNGGDLYLTGADDVEIRPQGGEAGIKVIGNGAVELYHDSSKKLNTTSWGINVTGSVQCDGLTVDGSPIFEGTSGVLTLKDNDGTTGSTTSYVEGKDSSNSSVWYVGHGTSADNALYVSNQVSGDINFRTGSGTKVVLQSDGHFRPAADDAYDLGTSTQQWRNGFFDDTVHCDRLQCDGDATVSSGSGKIIIQDNNNTGSGVLSQINGQDSAGTTVWQVGQASSANQSLYVWNNQNGELLFATNNTQRCLVSTAGHFLPSANNTYDLGESSSRWRNVYTNDLNLSNEGSTNDVDGTWGSWTIQEGEDDLFLLNRRNGKKYKFNLTEVS